MSTGTILSDRSDGTDDTAHLTFAGQRNATIARWYLCPVDVNDTLTQAQLDRACGDPATKLPPGLAPAKDWPCAAEESE